MIAVRNNAEAVVEVIGSDSRLPVLPDPTGGIAQAYSIDTMPSAVIIDGQGGIVSVRSGLVTAAQLRAAVNGIE